MTEQTEQASTQPITVAAGIALKGFVFHGSRASGRVLHSVLGDGRGAAR